MLDRLSGPPRRDLNGNTLSAVLGSPSRAARNVACIGTESSVSLLANTAGRMIRLLAQSIHGNRSEGTQRNWYASESRRPAHQPHMRYAFHSLLDAFSSIFS